ncbi:hypothetical protein RB595_001097 [Gaeumannomyces hyphopodioides]
MRQDRGFGSLPWLLLLSGIPAAVGDTTTGSRVLAVGAGACARNPLLIAAPAFCEVGPEMKGRSSSGRHSSPEPGTAAPTGANDTQKQQQRERERQQRSVDMSWRGPHFCVADMCVYSNPSFSQGRGVVVVGTARGAEAVANALDVARQPPPPREPAAGAVQFEQKEVPGKGLGLVAARPIRRGELIMARPPVIVVHQDAIDMEAEAARLRLYDAAMAQLPQGTVEDFLSLAVQSATKDRGRKVKDIMDTNSFNTVVGGLSHVASYLDVSRLNHDCRPNLVFHVSPSLNHMTYAVRDIAAGEELTISYLDPFRAREVRRARAERNWGFACTCSQCSLAPPLAAESDDRLWDIYQLESRLRDWPLAATSPPSAPPAQIKRETSIGPDSAEALLKLYAEERLDCALGDAYALVALNYNAFGDAESAVKYARLAVEAGTMEHGEQGHDVQDMKKLLGSPEKHWSWRQRVIE